MKKLGSIRRHAQKNDHTVLYHWSHDKNRFHIEKREGEGGRLPDPHSKKKKIKKK